MLLISCQQINRGLNHTSFKVQLEEQLDWQLNNVILALAEDCVTTNAKQRLNGCSRVVGEELVELACFVRETLLDQSSMSLESCDLGPDI